MRWLGLVEVVAISIVQNRWITLANLHDIPSPIVEIPSVEISSGAFEVGLASSMVHPRAVRPRACRRIGHGRRIG
jgi:hypothetical protein